MTNYDQKVNWILAQRKALELETKKLVDELAKMNTEQSAELINKLYERK